MTAARRGRGTTSVLDGLRLCDLFRSAEAENVTLTVQDIAERMHCSTQQAWAYLKVWCAYIAPKERRPAVRQLARRIVARRVA